MFLTGARSSLITDSDDLNNTLGKVDYALNQLGHTLGRMNERLNSINESSGRVTRQMGDVLRNQSRIIESNERSAESLLQIQRMMFALIVITLIGLFIVKV